MNAVGIDVSSRKSTVALLRPLGEVVCLPFDVTFVVDVEWCCYLHSTTIERKCLYPFGSLLEFARL